MDEKFYITLQKYLNGDIGEEEFNELRKEIGVERFDKLMSESVDLELRKNQSDISSEAYEKSKDRIQQRLHAEIDLVEEDNNFPIKPLSSRSRFQYSKVWMAASVALVLAFSTFLFWRSESSVEEAETPVASNKVVIQPGSDKAVLTLADGTELLLGSENGGNIAEQNGVKIIQLDGGKLSYEGAAAEGETIYNTISTPRGGQYQIVLPDGSNVRLNASSSLRFPTVFKKEVREVYLTGQGYFEVAASKSKPFIVNAENLDVIAMGTQFDIMAYSEENEISATLVEGLVQVGNDGSNSVLKPGQQARKVEGNELEVKYTNVEEIVAWTKGEFHFGGTPVESIMRQIRRWYDVEVQYEGDFSSVKLSGVISRKKNMTDLLEALEATGDIAFKTEGRMIKVLPVIH